MSRGPRVALCAAIAAASALAGGAAHAAGNINVTKVTRSSTPEDRSSSNEYFISYEDCRNNVEFTFAIEFPAGGAGSVWISEGECKTAASRMSTGNCTSIDNFSESQSFVLDAAQIAGALTGVDVQCNDTSGSATARPVNIWFLAKDDGDLEDVDAFVWDKTKIDLLGPEPPSGLTLGVGNGIINVNMPTANADTTEYIFFCDPPVAKLDAGFEITPGDSTCDAGTDNAASSSSSSSSSSSGDAGADAGPDAGTGGAGGAGGAGGGGAGGAGGVAGAGGTAGAGGASTGQCNESDAGIPGLQVGCSPHAVANVCQVAMASQVKVTIPNLENGTTYKVAVAAVDEVGNIGPLSPIVCETPWETNAFFQDYCANGGQACQGCGFCTIGSDVELTGPALAWGALVVAGFAVRRASRRRRSGGDVRGPRGAA